jgi:HEPN domain-containing protein
VVDDEEFGRWRTEAEAGREMARQARLGTRHNWTCFLAEQSAQLAVKALLHGLGTGPWGHDLVRMGRSWAEAVGAPLPPSLDDAMVRLSRLYIATRYPDAHPAGSPGEHYTAGDADLALADLDLVITEVDDMWQQLHRHEG